MNNVKEMLFPQNIKSAVSMMKKHKNAAFISGGTSFRLYPTKAEYLIDLSRLLDHKITRTATGITIPAGTTMQNIVESRAISRPEYRVLREAAKTVGGLGLRNQITLGGNLAMRYPWSNMPVALLAFDAKVRTAGTGKKTISADDFFSKPKAKVMNKSDIITDIVIKLDKSAAMKSSWFRFGYNDNDIPIMNMATVITVKKKKIVKARLVVGSVTALPTRLANTEKFLESDTTGSEMFLKALSKDINGLKLLPDVRVTRDYIKELVQNKVSRQIIEILDGDVI